MENILNWQRRHPPRGACSIGIAATTLHAPEVIAAGIRRYAATSSFMRDVRLPRQSFQPQTIGNAGQPADHKREADLTLHSAMLNDAVPSSELGDLHKLDPYSRFMYKRYQVFLSSTFRDLEIERLDVMRALLELDCFPSGMEYFPAANEDQWSFIKDLIDQCDYYIVVIGGRYGSVDEAGVSFTEKEYRYAVERGIPVIGFIHAAPESISQGKSEQDAPARAKLEEFKRLVQSRLCKEWASASELGAVVSRSLTQLIRRNPRPGWVRATHLASAEASEEIIRLRQLNDALKDEVARISLARPTGSEALAQGEDEVELTFVVTLSDPDRTYPRQHNRISDSEVFTWKDLLSVFGPYLLTESKLSNVKGAINRLIRDRVAQAIIDENPDWEFGAINLTEASLQLVVVQFTALGYLQLSMSKDDNGKEVRLASLTTLGKYELLKATAVRRGIRETLNKSIATRYN